MLLGSHHTSPVRCQIGIERMMARREGIPPRCTQKVDLGSFVQMQSRSISYYYLAGRLETWDVPSCQKVQSLSFLPPLFILKDLKIQILCLFLTSLFPHRFPLSHS